MYPNNNYSDLYQQFEESMQFATAKPYTDEQYQQYQQAFEKYPDNKYFPDKKSYPDNKYSPAKKPYPEYKQKHVHELQGSTKIAEKGCDAHNHRFATVTGEAKRIGCTYDHYHEVKFKTDTFDDHQHEFCGQTSGAIYVGDGRHVHFLKGCTSVNDGHYHPFRAATFIENPIE